MLKKRVSLIVAIIVMLSLVPNLVAYAAQAGWNILINPTTTVDNIYSLSEDTFIIGTGLQDNSKAALYNGALQLIKQTQYDTYSVGSFSNGRAPFSVWNASPVSQSLYGYIDKQGDTKIPMNYLSAGEFINGAAVASIINSENPYSQCYGAINPDGNVIIPFDYDYMVNTPNYIKAISYEPYYTYTFFDHSGNNISTPSGLNASPWNAAEMEQKEQAFGSLYPQDQIFCWSDEYGNFAIRRTPDCKYGLLDQNGSVMIPPLYDDNIFEITKEYYQYKPFANNELFFDLTLNVNNQRMHGIADRNGTVILPAENSLVYPCQTVSNGVIFIYYKNGTYGACRGDGTSIIALGSYADVEYFNVGGTDVLKVKDTNSICGILDMNANTILNTEYDDIFPVKEGAYIIKKTIDGEQMVGMLNSDGSVLVECQYKRISVMNNGARVDYIANDYNKTTDDLVFAYHLENAFAVDPTSVTLDVSSKTLPVGSTYSLIATVLPDGATPDVTWTSSKTSVATVDTNGLVTAKGVGAATITVKTINNKTATCNVTVKLPAPTGSAKEASPTSIKVSWNQITGASGYYIYRATSSTGTFFNIAKVTSGSTLSYTNTGLTTGKTYYYKVQAYHSTSTYNSVCSAVVSAKAAPIVPTGVKAASTGYNSINVTWGKVSGASGYEVYRSATSGGTYTKIKTISGGSTVSYTNTGLTTGTPYYYKVAAYTTVSGTIVTGTSSTAANAIPIPAAPANTAAASVGYDSIRATWDKVPGATGYYIFCSTSSAGTYTKIATITNPDTLLYTNTGLATNKIYYYKVVAYRTASGIITKGKTSAIVSAKPIPAAPTAQAASAGYNSIKVTWGKVSGASGYIVYRATSNLGTYSKIKTITSGSTISYTNTGLTAGKTYYYKVAAYTAVSSTNVPGKNSSSVSAKPIPSKTIVTLQRVSKTSIKVMWNAVAGASGYEVYRATSQTGTPALLTTAKSTATSYTDTGLTSGKTYYYKVRAYRMVGTAKVYAAFSEIVGG